MGGSRLEDEVQEFTVRLMLRLAEIIPAGDLGFTCDAVAHPDGSARMAVASAHTGGIPLTVDGSPILQLAVNYRLVMSPTSNRASVAGSSFLVRPFGESRPLFTADYVRGTGSNVPAAHYNFHFDHGDVEAKLLDAGRKRRGKIHQKHASTGRTPRLADLHFPVGGHRFRLCLEDVLEMLCIEFGIDVKDTAGEAIAQGREEWRRVQVRAAVSDDPEGAAAELRSLGYVVTDPTPLPGKRMEMVRSI